MLYVDGGSKATQALMSGDVPIAQVGGNAPVGARKVRSAKPEDFVDMNIIKEFDANGFIDRLYEKR